MSAGQMTYDLRRLHSHHLIERVPCTHRYRVTVADLQAVMFLTRVHDRVLPAGSEGIDMGRILSSYR